MKIGIVGLPRSGKTTLLGALTGFSAADAGYARAVNQVIVTVPEPRLDRLYEIFQPRKKTPTSIEFVDLPGIQPAKPGIKTDTASVLGQVRQVDCLLLVLRAFDRSDDPHPAGSVDPARDLVNLRTELAFSDLEIVSGRIERIDERLKRPIPQKERDELDAERALIASVAARLEAGGHVRDLAMQIEVEKKIRSFQLLRKKPEVVVVNTHDPKGGKVDDPEGVPQIGLSAEIERELLRLDGDDRTMFMSEYGLEKLSVDQVIRAAYRASGLISFFTGGGPDEVRAWTLVEPATAVDAAAAIHTDLATGFIRAEVVSFDDLSRCGDIKTAKAEGVWRLEGKEYRVKDGDVITIRHNK